MASNDCKWRKRKMASLNTWRMVGVNEVYETTNGIIIQRPKTKLFHVFGRKQTYYKGKRYPRVDSHGDIQSTNYNNFAGAYGTKREALDTINDIENGIKGNKLVILEMSGAEIPPVMMHDGNPKHKGAVILVHRNDEVGLAHELGHYWAGHMIKPSSDSFNHEIEATEREIEYLHNKGKYTKPAKDEIIRYLSHYSKKPHQKKRRAIKTVKKIEQRLGIT